MQLAQELQNIPPWLRVSLIILLTVVAHYVVKGIRRLSQYFLSLKVGGEIVTEESLSRKYPQFATIMTLVVSAVTFLIYFMSVGMVLHEFKISLTTYFASATVIGLAVGFGLQGFVQDLVIGLTMTFSDALNIGDVVKLGDEIGKVDTIGLRFTTLINLHGQKILIPNRNIGTIGQFRGGCIRAYVDVQLPKGGDEKEISKAIFAIARGMYLQHKSIILAAPELFGVKEVRDGNWRYLRVKFKLWPGQSSIIEETFQERVNQLLLQSSPEYAPWMITTSFRVE